MDAIGLLKEDHKRVRDNFRKLATIENAEQGEALLQTIEKDLQMHAAIEEEIFYPAFRDAAKPEDRKLFFEAREEHHVVKLVLPEIRNLDPEVFIAKAKVLRELVEHHMKEEEKKMFPKAREVLSRQELITLGERMQTHKESILESAYVDRSFETEA